MTMRNAIRLYGRYVGVSIRGQMQYRASFVMASLGHFLTVGLEFVGIWVLFQRFESLRGWSLAEVALFYGLINVAFAVAESMGRGFDVFPHLIRCGGFDRVLLRPRRAAFQIAAQEMQLMRVGRLTQGLIVLIWAGAALDVHWTAARVALSAFAVIGGACLFYGLFVLQATLTFWTIEGLEIMNTLTYGGTETAQYPLAIYRPWFRRFFTFIVPLACVSYFPALAILGKADRVVGSPAWFQWAAPLIGVAFLAVALRIWKVGVRHYRSTGS
jgi:ABC-2 type transport system permease protein